MLLIKVQTRGNKQGCIGDIICTFHKAIMYNNLIHYSRKSVFVQKKNYQRSHNVFKIDKVHFTGVHCTPRELATQDSY